MTEPAPIDQSYFGPGACFHHVGIVVASITDAAGDDVPRVEDPHQKAVVAFVSIHGLPVEYVEPVGDDSPVAGSLRRGQKLLHLCFSTPDIEGAIAHAKEHGFRLIAAPVPATAFCERRIAWLISPVHGVVELVEAE
jgi:methylmalonyl-CoA/ethylmalonyl-CoA epimerase